MNATAEKTMASKRNDVSVKIDIRSIEVARKAASLKEKTLAEYLSDVVLEAASRDLKSEAAKITREDDPPAKPKR